MLNGRLLSDEWVHLVQWSPLRRLPVTARQRLLHAGTAECMCPRKVASCDARRAMTSASTTKAKRQAQQQCTAANCPRSARLDAVLTENAFLGETVATLQNAVQVANHRADALAQEVESLQTRRKELEAVAEKACGAAQRMSTLERQLEDVSNKCRLLREEKTDLLERSWETLEQLRLTRQRNDRLEQRLSELHEEIDQEVLHSRLCASKHIISKVRVNPR